jgi:hypothetical protein
MAADEVTILIPHFQTLDAIRLCLRALRRHTPAGYRVRVLDNGSRDASRDYLRSLAWIELVDTGLDNETWQSHFECLNAAVAAVTTPYFVVMHSDLYVHDGGWLQFLRGKLDSGPYAAVGARHQSIPARGPWTLLWRVGAFFERRLAGAYPRLRSLCALFRTDAFRAAGCRFTTSVRHQDITFVPVEQLLAAGHRVLTLPACTLCKYMFHTSATTRIANKTYRKNPARHLRELAAYRRLPPVAALLRDDALDA